MKIYTRTGDSGDTALFDGTRVLKSDARVAAYGDLDELNAWLGLVRAHLADGTRERSCSRFSATCSPSARDSRIRRIALPDGSPRRRSTPEDVARLERWIDAFDASCRRCAASSSLAGLRPAPPCMWRAPFADGPSARWRSSATAAFENELLQYVNRLSDLLFTMARVVNHRAGVPEIEW